MNLSHNVVFADCQTLPTQGHGRASSLDSLSFYKCLQGPADHQ